MRGCPPPAPLPVATQGGHIGVTWFYTVVWWFVADLFKVGVFYALSKDSHDVLFGLPLEKNNEAQRAEELKKMQAENRKALYEASGDTPAERLASEMRQRPEGYLSQRPHGSIAAGAAASPLMQMKAAADTGKAPRVATMPPGGFVGSSETASAQGATYELHKRVTRIERRTDALEAGAGQFDTRITALENSKKNK